MALSFGGALEALKSGEVIKQANGNVRYRFTPGSGHVTRITGDVSTTTQAFGLSEVMAEDWIIEGYAQEGIKHHGSDQETLSLDLSLGAEAKPVSARDVHIPGAALGAGVNRG